MSDKGSGGDAAGNGRDRLRERVLDTLAKRQSTGLSRKELTHVVAQELGDTSKPKIKKISDAITALVNEGAAKELIFLHPGSRKLQLFGRAQILVKPRRRVYDAGSERDYLRFLREVSSRIVRETETRWPRVLEDAIEGLPDAIRESIGHVEIAIVDVEMIHSSLDDFDMIVTVQFRSFDILMLYVRSFINSLEVIDRTHTQYIHYSLVREERAMTKLSRRRAGPRPRSGGTERKAEDRQKRGGEISEEGA